MYKSHKHTDLNVMSAKHSLNDLHWHVVHIQPLDVIMDERLFQLAIHPINAQVEEQEL